MTSRPFYYSDVKESLIHSIRELLSDGQALKLLTDSFMQQYNRDPRADPPCPIYEEYLHKELVFRKNITQSEFYTEFEEYSISKLLISHTIVKSLRVPQQILMFFYYPQFLFLFEESRKQSNQCGYLYSCLGWKNPYDSLTLFGSKLMKIYKDCQEDDFCRACDLSSHLFDDFIYSYPQYINNIDEFQAILFHIYVFITGNYEGFLYVDHDSWESKMIKYWQFSLIKHVDLLERMVSFYSPPRLKYTRSYILPNVHNVL